MRPLPLLAEPLTDGQVVLRDYAERDIPEILIAHQDDPRMHLLTGEDRPCLCHRHVELPLAHGDFGRGMNGLHELEARPP